MCGKRLRSGSLASLLFLLLFCFCTLSASAEDTSKESATPQQSTSPSSPTPISEPQSQLDWRTKLVELWTTYDQAYYASATSLDQFLSQVEALGISYEALPGYITWLETSLKDLQESHKAELLLIVNDKAVVEDELAGEKTKSMILAWALGASGGAAILGWIFYAASASK